MIKQIKKVGNGSALFVDKDLLELVGLDVGGQVQLTVSNGSIIVTPVEPGAVSQERFESALEQMISGFVGSDTIKSIEESRSPTRRRPG